MKAQLAQQRCRSAAQRGMSLIEMMIALVLGLIVITALLNMYVGSSRSAAFSEGLRTMQENGRHGIQVLKRGIRLAGYSPDVRIPAFDIANSGNDKLIVRMVAERDCNGVATAAVGGIAVNTYELDAGNEQITCQGNSVTASKMPLVDGVENFRILYGIDEDNDGFPERYRTHDQITDPLRIRAIRLALLVTSQTSIRTRAVAETHVLLDQEIAMNDRKARHVFSTTVLLRNLR